VFPLMAAIIDALLGLIALFFCIPALVLLVECLAARPSRGNKALPRELPHPRVAVLIPAHNEECSVLDTFRSLKGQLKDEDRIVVIADHCTDRTADIARKAGAEVIEHANPSPPGKGHALNFGIRYLETHPPEIVLFMDADCIAHRGTVMKIANCAADRRRPAQACILAEPPPAPGAFDLISAFAYMVKCQARPAGLYRLGLPCHLMGTGMALPWPQVRRVRFRGDHLVEDVLFGIDLALKGYPALFCPQAPVSTWMPGSKAAAISQRTRWEHGHLAILLPQVKRLGFHVLRHGRWELVPLMLDLMVPPLSLFVTAAIVATSGILCLSLVGVSVAPAIVLSLAGGMVACALFLVWVKFGKKKFPPSMLFGLPRYLVTKLSILRQVVFTRHVFWQRRTERDTDHEEKMVQGKHRG
jgi:cellulose synthase/poly-beta-1,6-N-acetylglucosamine synthase-like glycosyltransferase